MENEVLINDVCKDCDIYWRDYYKIDNAISLVAEAKVELLWWMYRTKHIDEIVLDRLDRSIFVMPFSDCVKHLIDEGEI